MDAAPADHLTVPPPAPSPSSAPPQPAVPTPRSPDATRASRAQALEWWTKPVTRWVALLVVTALVAYLCWLMLAPFVDVLMWAVVLVVAFYPVHRRVLAKVRSPGGAAALSCLIVILTLLLPLTVITILVVNDATEFANNLVRQKERLLHPDPDTTLGRTMAWVEARGVPVERLVSKEYLSDRARALSGAIASRTLNVVGGLFGAVVQIFFVIFTMFYMFRDGERLRGATRQALPLDRWAAHDVFLRTKEVIHASVYGSLVIATVQGVLGGIMFAILGLPSPVLWGAVMILLSMIPMAGAAVVWVPAALFLLFTGQWVRAIILLAWGGGVIGTIDNVLRPRLVGSRTRMHELVIFFSVLGGLQVFGILGIVTGPAVAAVAIALFEVWKQAKPPAPVAAGAAAGAVTAAAASMNVVTPAPGVVASDAPVSSTGTAPAAAP